MWGFFFPSLLCRWLKAARNVRIQSWTLDKMLPRGLLQPQLFWESMTFSSSEELQLCVMVPGRGTEERESDMSGRHVWCANCGLPQVLVVQKCPRSGSCIALICTYSTSLAAGYSWTRLRREQLIAHNKYVMRIYPVAEKILEFGRCGWREGKDKYREQKKCFSLRVSAPTRVHFQFLSKTVPLNCCDLKSQMAIVFFFLC